MMLQGVQSFFNSFTGINSIAEKIFPKEVQNINPVGPDIIRYEDIEAARKDWVAAKSYFQSVTEPDLVDHAIYMVQATEKKYMYLLKKAKEIGVNVPKVN
jgi:hypothetical protein